MSSSFERGTATAAFLIFSASAPLSAGQSRDTTQSLAFTGVTVIDVRTGQLLAGQTVLVAGNRVRAVGPARQVRIPPAARVVNARGKYLIPGLWDMHAHVDTLADTYYPRFIAHGVTGIREMAQRYHGGAEVFRQHRREIVAGTRVGPRALGPSADLDQGNDIAIAEPEDARRVIDSLKKAGDAFVKFHGFKEPTVYFAILNEARRVGLPVVGHMPQAGVTEEQLADSGQRSLEHMNEYRYCWAWTDSLTGAPAVDSVIERKCAPGVKALIRNGTWIVPTLVVHDVAMFHLRPTQDFVRMLHRLGVRRFLTGTDLATIFTAGKDAKIRPGFSVLEEMVRLTEAGLPSLEALQAATLHPAMYFDAIDSLGTVTPGKLADLVLLDANPLADIHNARRIAAVVANGRYFDRAALDALDPEGTDLAKGYVARSSANGAAVPPLAFEGVTVIDVQNGQRVQNQTVVVTGSRITAMGETGKTRAPADARVVNARGKYLMPGLWDMHAHVDDAADRMYPLFVASGVTGIREMAQLGPAAADSFHARQRAIQAGTRLGPRAIGPSTDLKWQTKIATPDDARRVVDSIKAAGDAFAKVHDDQMPHDLYFAVAREARRTGLPFVGHVPTAVTEIEAADSGQRSLEHVEAHHACWPTWPAPLDSLAKQRCAPSAAAIVRNHTWLVPTLAKAQWVDRNVPAAQKLVKILRRLGVTNFLTGTDVFNDADEGLRPGESVIEEVILLAEAGLTSLEALQAATLHPAQFLGATDSLGTVAPGKLADLVLLDADPLADVHNMTRIQAVVTNGRYFHRVDLDAMKGRRDLSPER